MWAVGLGGAVAGVSPAAAIPPIGRTRPSQIKLSLAAYSFRKYLQAKENPMTLFDFIDLCADLRLDGTEPTSYYFPSDVTAEYLAQIKRRAFVLGLDISGTAIRNDFCVPPGEKRDSEIAHVKKWVDYAAQFGAGTIRIFSGSVSKGHTLEEAQTWFVECAEETCAYAGQKGVFLALENHGGISVSADLLLTLLERVKSPWFGINLDTGNFHTADPYDDMARVAPYAVNVQVKTEVGPGENRVPADFDRIIAILRDAKYSGYVALEYEAREDPKTAVPREIERLREALANAGVGR
ncbi:xylose isomerase [candidate division BRC1 bacterium SM23_51]|nr:MAG: xylose isomerase [candidate division BRC1 bacterium SM23_51]